MSERDTLSLSLFRERNSVILPFFVYSMYPRSCVYCASTTSSCSLSPVALEFSLMNLALKHWACTYTQLRASSACVYVVNVAAPLSPRRRDESERNSAEWADRRRREGRAGGMNMYIHTYSCVCKNGRRKTREVLSSTLFGLSGRYYSLRYGYGCKENSGSLNRVLRGRVLLWFWYKIAFLWENGLKTNWIEEMV